MRRKHFETLQPICPRCSAQENVIAPLILSRIEKETQDNVLEGLLVCSNNQCKREYPIIHGIPIIVPNVREYLKNNLLPITQSSDFSSVIDSILGDASGAGSEFNNSRHHLSTYGWDHYADKADEEEFGDELAPKISGVVSCLEAGLDLLPGKPEAPVLDIGCALGRSTFELANTIPGLTLGIDINFWKLRLAQMVLQEKRISFPLKQYGVAYKKHTFDVSFTQHESVDFWACNALSLPFQAESFNFCSALNIIDILPAPKNLLLSLRRILRKDGQAIVSTPYDWSPPTNMENWLGGYAQHNDQTADSEQVLRNLIDNPVSNDGIGGMKLLGEIQHHPWNLRVHKRRIASYDVHILACKKT